MLNEERQKKKALFPGSFDPITLGHLDIIKESLNIFDEVVVGIGMSHQKNYSFSDSERIKLADKALKDFGKNVQICCFKGLAVKFASKINAEFIVRGLRTESDFSYEMPMAMTNRKLESKIITVFIPTSAANHYVSSSLVREIALLGGDITAFVPKEIAEQVKIKLSPKDLEI